MRISKRIAAALAIAAVGGPAIVTLAQADDPPPAPPTTTEPVPATPAQKAAFAVLDRAASTAEADNGSRMTRLADAAQRGFAPDDARIVGATGTGPIWLVPANGALCLALEDVTDDSLGASCEPSEAVITRGITVGDGTTAYGLVPDGVTSVTVDDGVNTTTVEPDPGSSVYALDTGEVSVAVDGPGGVQWFDVASG